MSSLTLFHDLALGIKKDLETLCSRHLSCPGCPLLSPHPSLRPHPSPPYWLKGRDLHPGLHRAPAHPPLVLPPLWAGHSGAPLGLGDPAAAPLLRGLRVASWRARGEWRGRPAFLRHSASHSTFWLPGERGPFSWGHTVSSRPQCSRFSSKPAPARPMCFHRAGALDSESQTESQPDPQTEILEKVTDPTVGAPCSLSVNWAGAVGWHLGRLEKPLALPASLGPAGGPARQPRWAGCPSVWMAPDQGELSLPGKGVPTRPRLPEPSVAGEPRGSEAPGGQPFWKDLRNFRRCWMGELPRTGKPSAEWPYRLPTLSGAGQQVPCSESSRAP